MVDILDVEAEIEGHSSLFCVGELELGLHFGLWHTTCDLFRFLDGGSCW